MEVTCICLAGKAVNSVESPSAVGGIVGISLSVVFFIRRRGFERGMDCKGRGRGRRRRGRCGRDLGGGVEGTKGGYSCQHFYTCRGTIASPRHLLSLI